MIGERRRGLNCDVLGGMRTLSDISPALIRDRKSGWGGEEIKLWRLGLDQAFLLRWLEIERERLDCDILDGTRSLFQRVITGTDCRVKTL